MASSPVVVGGVVYVRGGVNNVYALNADTGALLWSYATGGPVGVPAGGPAFSSPAVSNGVVYVGAYDRKVYALNAVNGALVWSYETGGETASSPAVSNGHVFIGSNDYKLHALDASTGSLQWSYTTGSTVFSSPASSGNTVYFGSGDSKVYALNSQTGAVRWIYQAARPINSSPAVANGVVYVGSVGDPFGGKVHGLDAVTGTLLWSYATDQAISTSPAVSNGILYFGSLGTPVFGASTDGKVYAFEAEPPPISLTVAPYHVTLSVPIIWNVSTTWAGKGADSYDVQYRDGPSGTWTDVLTSTVSTSISFSGQDGHTYGFRARSRTVVAITGDWSAPVTTTVDVAPPVGSVQTQAWTSPYVSKTVALILTAFDATSGPSQMQFSTDGTAYSNWETYATGKSYTASAGTTAVYVRFQDNAGNISQPVSATVALDATPPAGSIQAQGWTSPWNAVTVTLALSATDSTSGVSQMSLSSDGQTYSDWETFATARSYLTPAGITAVYARYKDQAGNISSTMSTTVALDSVPPTGTFSISGGARDTTAITVTLALSATDSLSGVTDSSYSNDSSAWSNWEIFAMGKQWTVTDGDGAKTIWGRFRDAANNVSAPISRTINLDTTLQGIAGVSVNDGSLFTNQVTVTLSLPAPSPSSEMILSSDGAFAGASWEPYTAYKPWAIPQYGSFVLPRTVYVKYKDVNGNISGTYQDDIVLDINAPTGSVSIERTGTAERTASGTVTLGLSASDDASGVGGMMVSNSPTFSGAAWESFAATKPWELVGGARVYAAFKDNAGNASPVYAASLSGPQESLPSVVLGAVHPKTGGQLGSEETRIAITFPAGAVSAKADLTLVPAVESSLESNVGSLKSAGKFLTVTAKAGDTAVTSFGKAYTMTIGYSAVDIADINEDSLAIYTWNGTEWVKEAASALDKTTKTVSASIDHLSSFALLGVSAAQSTASRIYLPLVIREASGW